MATMEVLQWLQESYWTSSNTFFSDNLPATTWGTKNPNHVANMSFEDIDSFNQGKDGLLMPLLNISSLNIRDPSQPMTSAANLGLATGFLLVVLLNSHFETIKREWRNEYQQWAETVLASTVFVIACILLSLAVTPLVMLIFISLMFYRQTVQVILWLVHGKRFAGLMEGADTVWALEDDMSKSVINILAMLQVSTTNESLGEGLLTSLRQLVLSRILTSPQRCPKLLYYRRKSALGYFYWERQNELHLENHIRWMETGMDISDGISEEILGGVVSELANAPLPDQHASSWEILVGRNFISEPNMNVKTSLEEGMSGKYNKQKYPVLFRVHHSLGDGVALLQLLMKTLVDVCNENKTIPATPLRKTVLATFRARESPGIPIQNKDELGVGKLQNKVKRPDSPFEKYQNVKPVKHSIKAVTKDISSTMLNRDTINPTFPASKPHSKQLNYNSNGTKMSYIPQYLTNLSNKMKVEESETSKEIKNKPIPSTSLQFKSDVVYSKTNTKLPCYSTSDSYITILDDTKGASVQTSNQNMKVYFKNPLSKSAIHSDSTNLEHTNKIQPNMQSLRYRKNSVKYEEKSKSASVTSKVLYHNGKNIEPAVSTITERSKANTSKCIFSDQMQHLNKTNIGPPLDMEVLKLALIPKSAERNSLPVITCTSATPNSKISVPPMYTQRSSPIHIKQAQVVESTHSPYIKRCLSPMSGFSSSRTSFPTSDICNHRSWSPMFDKETPRCSSAMSGFVNPDFPSAIPDSNNHWSQSPRFDKETPRCSSAMSGFVNPDFPSAIPDSSNHRSQSPRFDKETPRCSSTMSGFVNPDFPSAIPDSNNHWSQSPRFDKETPRCSSAMSGFVNPDFPSAIPDNSNHRSQSPRFDKETPRCSSAMSGFVNPDFPSAIPDNSNHRSQSPRFDKETPRCSSTMSGFVNPDFPSAIPDSNNHRSQSPMFDKETPRCSSAMSGFVNPDFSSTISDNSHHRSQSPMFDNNRRPRSSSTLSGYISLDRYSAKSDNSNPQSQSSTFDNRTPRCSSALSGYITSDCSALSDNSNHRSWSPMIDNRTPRCSSAISGFIMPDFSPPISNKSNHQNCFSQLQNDSSHSSSQKLCLSKYNAKLSKHTKLSFSNTNPPFRRGSPSRLDLNTDKPATFISSGSQPDYLSSCKNTLEDNNFPSNYKQICDSKSFAAVGVGSNEYQPRSSTNVEHGKNLSKELKDIKNDSLFTTIPLDMIGKRPMTPTDYCSKVSSSLGGWQVLKNMFSKKKSNKMFVKKTKGTSSSNKYVKLLSTINNGEVSKYRCIGNFMHVICAIIYAPASLLHQALMKASDANTLHGPSLSGQKVIAWYTDSSTSTLDDEGQLLNTIKRIKSRAMCEARFTDIFLTALSASLEAYFLTGSNDNTIPESINVVVPIRMEPFPTKAVEIIKDEDSSKVLKNVSVEDTTQFMPTILEDLNELNHDYVVTEKRLNSILKNRSFTKDINPGLTFVDISEDKTSSNLLLDNRFSVALMTLPIVPPSCATSEKILKSYTLRSRLKEVCVQSELLRKSLDYQINYWLMRVVATVLPVALLSPVLRSTQSTMVVSNMKGPAEDVQIGGYKLSDLVFWVPNRGTTGVGVTLMSYAGRLQIGIIADRAVVPCRQDAQLILQGVVSELKYLDAMKSV